MAFCMFTRGYIYIIGWWCNFTILKNDGVRQWVSDDIPYMMEKKIETTNQITFTWSMFNPTRKDLNLYKVVPPQ